MPKVSVIGICGNSIFMYADHFHENGETLVADSVFEEIGGKGINQAVAAKRMGAEVSFLAAIGDDVNGKKSIQAAKENGINAHLKIKQGKITPFAFILTDKNGENRVTVYKTAELDKNDVIAFEDEIASSDILLLQHEVPDEVNETAVKLAKKHNVKVILNPAPIRNISDEMAEQVFVVTPNEQEMQAIDIKRFKNCITTVGKKGCIINGTENVFGIEVKAVDTTGAGDTFNGVLAVCLAEGMTLKAACRYAVRASGISVGRKYVLNAIPYREEIEKKMEKFKLWTPPIQPNILNTTESFGNIEWDYPTFIENIYEPLRKEYPDYITRCSIGFDTSSEYEMWAYEFVPENYKKTVYIQAGVHVIETDAYFGLAKLLTMIARKEDERLSYIRDNIRLLVVPVVSVWGISKRGKYEEIMSEERYKFYHNAAKVNANRDFYDQKAQETVNVINYIEKFKKEITFAVDCHSTTDYVLGAYLLPYSNNMPKNIADKLKAINIELYKKHPTNILNKFMGEEKDYITGPLTTTYNFGISEKFKIPAVTLEHNDYIYDKKLGTSLTMTLAVELIGNHLLQISEDEDFSIGNICLEE